MPGNYALIAARQADDAKIQEQLSNRTLIHECVSGHNLATFKGKIVIPDSLIMRFIQWYHEILNHPGKNRTCQTISQYFYHRGLALLVSKFVKDCETCQKWKRPGRRYGKLPAHTAPYEPWECIQIDLFGPWSFDDINGITRQIKAVTIIDVCTRWIEIQQYDSRRSEDISLIIDREWMSRYPRPSYAIFDNGTEFSSEFKELLASYGIKPKPTTVKNPQANSIVERSHLTIAENLKTMNLPARPFDEDSIHAILQNVAFGFRATYHSILRSSPGQLVFGRDMIVNATYVANWKSIKDRREKNMIQNNSRENNKRLNHDYQPGDRVFIINRDVKRKLDANEGPFEILKAHTNGTVEIRRSANVTERINIRRLHPVF